MNKEKRSSYPKGSYKKNAPLSGAKHRVSRGGAEKDELQNLRDRTALIIADPYMSVVAGSGTSVSLKKESSVEKTNQLM